MPWNLAIMPEPISGMRDLTAGSSAYPIEIFLKSG
jgi:hypothetical protein